MTFSIVARDCSSGEVGVAVATCHFAVGALVAHVVGDVAVATQAETNPLLGVRGVLLMQAGMESKEALTALLAADSEAEQRQVHACDAVGGAHAHTGSACVDWAGHKVFPAATSKGGVSCSCAGNMLVGPQVLDAMASAFKGCDRSKPLAERLLCALEAGDAAGGDKRGRMSAAIKVCSKGQPYAAVDIRVDFHATPVQELRRLYKERLKPYAANFYDTRPKARSKL